MSSGLRARGTSRPQDGSPGCTRPMLNLSTRAASLWEGAFATAVELSAVRATKREQDGTPWAATAALCGANEDSPCTVLLSSEESSSERSDDPVRSVSSEISESLPSPSSSSSSDSSESELPSPVFALSLAKTAAILRDDDRWPNVIGRRGAEDWGLRSLSNQPFGRLDRGEGGGVLSSRFRLPNATLLTLGLEAAGGLKLGMATGPT